MDRLSCRRFVANAFRLALTAVAYNLIRAYRDMPAGTELESALSAEAQAGSVQTISYRLIKIGARARRTVRFHFHLSHRRCPLEELSILSARGSVEVDRTVCGNHHEL